MTPDNPRPFQRIVTCPGCGGPSVYSADNAFRPFCGERCKNHDLGAWASESFAIPAKPGVEDIFEAPERLQ